MTLAADALPDSAPLGRDLLELVRKERRTADTAELTVLRLAVAYAHANPVLPGEQGWQPRSRKVRMPVWHDSESSTGVDAEDVEWAGLPAVRWDAPAAFAAANRMSTTAGKGVIRDALVLAHRAPGVWAATIAGQVRPRTARQVAQALLGQHDDVCRYVDEALCERLAEGHHVGPVVAQALVDEAMLRLHAEERELEQLEQLDRRHVTVDADSINHAGIVDVVGRADWADAAPFDETLSRLAHTLLDDPDHAGRSLDERRSIALGIIADPARALALLEGDHDAAPTRRRQLTAVLDLTDGNLLGIDPVVTDADLKTHLTQVIGQWTGRPDVTLSLRTRWHCGGPEGGCTDCPGVIDCDDHSAHALDDYTPSARDREVLARSEPRCVFPDCHRSGAACDCDHVVPFHDGGPTCPRCNLAPLCRHHHRHKTLTGWRHWKLGPSTYLWRDPHGLLYLRTRDATRALD